MRRLAYTIIALTLSGPATAGDLTREQECVALGTIAEQASRLCLNGVEQDQALDTILQAEDTGASSIAPAKIKGAVRISYMAKMQPEKMRDYYVRQCTKDILR
jgi:hypothetical protein